MSVRAFFAIAFLDAACGFSNAGTMIRANSPGSNGMGNQNSAIPQTFGDNIAFPAPGNVVFETYADVGALAGTPNIDLNWSATSGTGSNRWEFHAWAGATAANSGGGTLQMDGSSINSTFSITFTPTANAAVVLKSFNFIGDTNGDTYQYRVDLVNSATNAVEHTQTTALWTTATAQNPGTHGTYAGAPAVSLNFTGTSGSTYRLDLTRIAGSGSGSAVNIAIDNLDFDQHLTISPPPGIPDGLVGLWDFTDPADIGKATHGTDLTVVGMAPTHSATVVDGAIDPRTLSGVITSVGGTSNHLRAVHGIGANGSGQKTNRHTLVFDIRVPTGTQWRSFYQTALANNIDAQYFVRNSDNRLGRTTITYSNQPIPADRWMRLAISVDLSTGGFYRTYLDGQLFFNHTKPAVDGEYALDPAQLLFFADNNNENQPLDIAMAAVFSKALDSDEIAALGTAGIALIATPGNNAPTLVAGPAGTSETETGIPAIYQLTGNDADGDAVQLQVDWGDGTISSWTTLAASGATRSFFQTWNTPGTYVISARVRDSQGAVTPWSAVQSVAVSGTLIPDFLTPPYLQNLGQTTMVVMVELAENLLMTLEYGSTGTFDSSVTMESVASGGGTFFIRGVLSGLQPGTTYHYRLSAYGQPVTSPATFRTAPANWQDFSFGALGDTQTTNGGVWQADPWEPAKLMLAHMADRGVAFGIALGDQASDGNSYISTKNSHLNRWAAVLGPRAPFYVSWGNHDGSSPNHPLRLASDMPSRWQAAESSSTRTPGYGNYWFEHSGVFFVCLDYFQTHNKSASDPTNDITNGWLDTVLSSPAARSARFRILAVHVPPFCERWLNGNATLRSQLVPRLEQHRVDLCISGHMHGYERGRINGVNYVISGAGSYLDFNEPLVADWSSATDDGIWRGGHVNIPGSYAKQISNGVLGPPEPIIGGLFHSYSQISVRDRYLRLDQHAFNADGSYIGILDSFEIGGADPGPDSDGDGMRDVWELAHGLDSEDPDDAASDLDGDGQPNIAEWLAGTSPSDASSMFRSSVAGLSAETLMLSWTSVPGKRYRISTSPELANWSPVMDGGEALEIPATPSGNTTSHEMPVLLEKQFFRVEVLR